MGENDNSPTPYNFVNFKQGSSHMVRMAYNIHIRHVFSAACQYPS